MGTKPYRDTVPKVINGRINGRFAPGYSGNPGGSPEASRKALNKSTILEMHRAFNIGGRKAINKVMTQQPAVFLKLLCLLVPRELEVSHSGTIKSMSDEQIEAAIQAITEMLEGRSAKVIDAVAEPEPVALPAPNGPSPEAALGATLEPTKRKPNRLMMEVDTAIGPQERKPRKRKVPSPTSA
jgi:hypothetical protein